ncbi:MAG TPA: hypothetical protein PK530_12190 [Anaerolineales bacterium]|nr:hypothetical protein [Anaerolineales bacterium]
MQPLSASQLLGVWETGWTQSPLHRALTILTVAFPEISAEALASLPMGQRDARLLALRAQTFGPRLNSLAMCPACGERLELAFDVDDICVGEISDGHPPAPEATLSLSLDDYSITFRLPNSLDLAAVTNEADPRQLLLTRCLLTAAHKGKPCSPTRLPQKIVQALVEKMSEVDPQADIQLDLTCPACQHEWLAAFDILAFFWTEIHHWAQRTLREIHLLAVAYGWSEHEILALSPWRRAMYLQMVMQ